VTDDSVTLNGNHVTLSQRSLFITSICQGLPTRLSPRNDWRESKFVALTQKNPPGKLKI